MQNFNDSWRIAFETFSANCEVAGWPLRGVVKIPPPSYPPPIPLPLPCDFMRCELFWGFNQTLGLSDLEKVPGKEWISVPALHREWEIWWSSGKYWKAARMVTCVLFRTSIFFLLKKLPVCVAGTGMDELVKKAQVKGIRKHADKRAVGWIFCLPNNMQGLDSICNSGKKHVRIFPCLYTPVVYLPLDLPFAPHFFRIWVHFFFLVQHYIRLQSPLFAFIRLYLLFGCLPVSPYSLWRTVWAPLSGSSEQVPAKYAQVASNVRGGPRNSSVDSRRESKSRE